MKNAVMFAVTAAALLFSCQGSTAGAPCTVAEDCEKGESCYLTGFPGGFCTRGCVREGSTQECPGGTICTRSTTGVTFCSTLCTDGSGCRGGQYACAAVNQSDKLACRP